MSELPDVLDAMGRTPREFGGVHVHFEGFRVVDGARCIATLLAQTAFVPGSEARVRLLDGEFEVAAMRLPNLDDGRVVRLHLACQRRTQSENLTLAVDAAEPSPKALRVRPAWKLFDTIEIPKLSEMNPVHDDVGGVDLASSFALTAVAGPLLGAVVLRMNGSSSLPANERTKVHRAMELPALAAGLLPGVARPVDDLFEEVVWVKGQPVPEAPPIVPLVSEPQQQAAPATRWCRSCGFEGPRAEYDRARSCPRCDEPWL